MKSNFAIQTTLLLASWLVLQNFNAPGGMKPLPVLGKDTHVSTLTARKGSDWADHEKKIAPFGPAYRIKKVVLDAGHGGKDPGCVGASSHEKDNALGIVLKLGALMSAHFPGLDVIYTRDKDEFIELNERARIANRQNADLFISIHCNSLSVKRVAGTETYVLGQHRAAHNLEVAKRENSVITMEENYRQNYGGYDPDSPEAHIFSSVWQSAYLEQSILFAGFVQEFAASIAGREDRGVKQAGFLVLRETAMPAVLIESGYLTNATEEAYLASEEGQQQMADAIFAAFQSYKWKMEGGVAANKPQPLPKQNPVAVKPTPAKQVAINKTPPKTNNAPAKPAAKYRIFLIAYLERRRPDAYPLSLVSGVQEELINGKYFYFTGTFATRAEAEKVLPEYINLGFKSASVEPVKTK